MDIKIQYPLVQLGPKFTLSESIYCRHVSGKFQFFWFDAKPSSWKVLQPCYRVKKNMVNNVILSWLMGPKLE